MPLKMVGKLTTSFIAVIFFLLILGVVRTSARIEIQDELRKGTQIKSKEEATSKKAQIKIKEEVKIGARTEEEEEEEDEEADEELDEEEDEEAGVFVKEIRYTLPFRPPPSPELIALKTRQRQLMEMTAIEKIRLKTATELTKWDIRDHIAWLENSLLRVNKNLDRFTKEEGPIIPVEALQKLTEEFTNRELTLDDMNSVAELVTMAYQEEGYILARAYVPEQEIEDGVLKIAITEGDIGEIKVSGQKYYNERVIKRQFEEQMRHKVIREDLLERGLLLTKDLPAAETKVKLHKGEKPGTADLELETEDSFAFMWSVDWNNFGSEFVGKDRFGTRVEVTDPVWGSTLAVRGVSGKDRDATALTSADLSIPVSAYGTKISLRYIEGLYAVGQRLEELGLEGDSVIYGGRLSHPILKTRDRNLNLTLGYDYKDSRNYMLEELRSIDKLHVWSATLDYDSLDRFLGKNLVSLGIYYGRVQDVEQAPPGREILKPTYERISVNLARIQKVYGFTNVMGRFSGQYSNDRLLPIEQMVLGGYGTVRGHLPSLFLGDSGYMVSVELMTAPPFIAEKTILGQRVGQMVQLALFFDQGVIFIRDPGILERENENLAGYGGGVRFYYKDILQFKFDMAFPYKKKDPDENDIFLYFLLSLNIFR